MDGPPDWDLLAVVRSCSSTTATTTASPPSNPEPSPPPPPLEEQLCFPPSQPPTTTTSSNSLLFGFSNPLNTTSFSNGGSPQELQDICTPSNSLNRFQSFSSNSTVFTVSHQQRHSHMKPSHVIFGPSPSNVTTTSTSGTTSQCHRTRKRKNLMKKVCHVPAEGLSSDMWAWRKYGQKPIKGSPYPRGYYRCSSSKGCLARKQVERNRSDPKMFIVTYTSEHNHPMPTHRNSLAGSTRQKPVTPPSPSAASLYHLTEPSVSKTEDEDTDMGRICDFMLNDDFFVGFEQIDGGSDDSDCFSEQFSPTTEFPWLSNGSTTATAAGGG